MRTFRDQHDATLTLASHHESDGPETNQLCQPAVELEPRAGARLFGEAAPAELGLVGKVLPVDESRRGAVLMTGGTGFLGLHLLRGLVLSGRKVVLLAHAGGIPGIDRVRNFLFASGDLKRLPRRLNELVSVFDIDISLPSLGLSAADSALAIAGVDEVWHVAATVMLDGRDEQVWRTNVSGTEHLLCLVDQTPANVLLRHISTAFVTGKMRDAVVCEGDSANAVDFQNVYERSKHAAEEVVRRWAAARSRSVLILRPSILIPGESTLDGLPEHTMHTVSQVVARITERRADETSRLVIRLGADPRAHLNLVQVDWAAEAMLRLSERVTYGIETLHVVHDDDVPVRCLSAALEDVSAVRLRMMPAKPSAPTESEKLFYRRMTGFLPYTYHRSHFDTAAMWAALADFPAPPAIGREQLGRCMQVSARSVSDLKVCA